MSAFITNNPRAPDLISIGEEAIAQENDALLRQYYAQGYVFHGPGADLDFEALREYFASVRDAFSDLRITRAIIIGEGECLDEKNARIPAAEAMRRAQVKPLVLEAKEAVSLINGTQGMLAVGVLALLAAETLVDSADVIGALTLDAL